MSIQGHGSAEMPDLADGDGGSGAVESKALEAPPAPLFVAPRSAPYHPPPPYPPPGLGGNATLDERAGASLALAILGIAFGLPLGLPGLILGAAAYFLGNSALTRIDDSQGTRRGHNAAVTGKILGIVAAVTGAVTSLLWVILISMALATSG